jgi:hypothetical protein
LLVHGRPGFRGERARWNWPGALNLDHPSPVEAGGVGVHRLVVPMVVLVPGGVVVPVMVFVPRRVVVPMVVRVLVIVRMIDVTVMVMVARVAVVVMAVADVAGDRRRAGAATAERTHHATSRSLIRKSVPPFGRSLSPAQRGQGSSRPASGTVSQQSKRQAEPGSSMIVCEPCSPNSTSSVFLPRGNALETFFSFITFGLFGHILERH